VKSGRNREESPDAFRLHGDSVTVVSERPKPPNHRGSARTVRSEVEETSYGVGRFNPNARPPRRIFDASWLAMLLHAHRRASGRATPCHLNSPEAPQKICTAPCGSFTMQRMVASPIPVYASSTSTRARSPAREVGSPRSISVAHPQALLPSPPSHRPTNR
jgi:hypothetical protein